MADVKGKKNSSTAEEYAESVLDVRRVAKVIKGGRRFGFSALVAVGDKKGRVGVALGKGREVSAAISKALKRAKKNMFEVPLYKTTIPFTIKAKHGASSVLIRSAAKGTGVIAGGAVRSVMDVLGVKDVLAKSFGSGNPQNVVKATVKALQMLKSAKQIAATRGKKLNEIVSTAKTTEEKDAIA
ncbi:30S ribosomal protein S5 [Candidatus Dependentiae bacterium]|nr:30S ribosomal protein S5 [Candidatus Dependentiae bacterium]